MVLAFVCVFSGGNGWKYGSAETRDEQFIAALRSISYIFHIQWFVQHFYKMFVSRVTFLEEFQITRNPQV